ncbi:hypothetical protein AAG906_005697 [Vitis piasezkii]
MTVSDFWETGVRGGKWCFSLQWHMHDWELEACIHEVSLYGEGEDKLWWKDVVSVKILTLDNLMREGSLSDAMGISGCIWKERTGRAFKKEELSDQNLKFFIKSFMEWSRAPLGIPNGTLLYFIDSINWG